MSTVHKKHKNIGERSLQVSRTYLRRGQDVSRSLWIKVSPRNPVLKAVFALPIGALLLMMLVLIMLMLGFTVLAVTVMAAISRGEEHTKGE